MAVLAVRFSLSLFPTLWTDARTEQPASHDGKPHADEEEDEHSLLSWPSTTIKRFTKVVSFPVLVLFYFTIPDCRKPRWERWYVVTFAMSIFWIAGITYLMFIAAFNAGCWAGIPDSVMGASCCCCGFVFVF
jgi:hypothetical protein